MNRPRFLKEIIPSTHITLLGEGELQERFARFKMTLTGGAIINKIASGQMKGLLREFEQNIRDKLENGR